MRRLSTPFLAAAMTLASPLLAQTPSYDSYQGRPIKALSSDEIAGLRAGSGLAMALPAELNRFPGPVHVLEHAAALGLTGDQVAALTRQLQTMRAQAILLGEKIIAEEEVLDGLFRSGTANQGAIELTTSRIGELRGQLRAVHLRTHLETRATLNEVQIASYQTLRGYDSSANDTHHKH